MTPIHKYNTFGKRFLAGLIDGLIFLPFSIFHNRIVETNNKELYLGWTILNTLCWTLYIVIGHGKYGQTVGKRAMNIKVFDLDEQTMLGYKRAFVRESIWFFTSVASIIYMVINFSKALDLNEVLTNMNYTITIGLISGVWLILELVTMLFNEKRRAIHDFLAGSVVIDLKELERENLQKQQKDLMGSLQKE